MRAVHSILRHFAHRTRTRSAALGPLFCLHYNTTARPTMEKNTNITNTSNTQRPFKNASLNNYFDFCKQNGPGFAINSKKIEILHDPPTFFNQLKASINKIT
jgi:hypothetical protein